VLPIARLLRLTVTSLGYYTTSIIISGREIGLLPIRKKRHRLVHVYNTKETKVDIVQHGDPTKFPASVKLDIVRSKKQAKLLSHIAHVPMFPIQHVLHTPNTK
jgi:hypothetical protein